MVGLRFDDRMHALPAPEVKSESEQFQCFVSAYLIISGAEKAEIHSRAGSIFLAFPTQPC